METMKNVAAALVKAQRAFGPALKDKSNPAFRSKYADLGACIDAVMDALNANGIALVQRQHPHEGGITIETLFVHESGEVFSAGMFSVPATKQDPQGYGSATTYARRYSLMAACGIAPEDDDGNAASRPRAQARDPERAAWLETQRVSILSAKNVGDLKLTLETAIAFARQQDDSAAVDQLHVWAEEKKAQAKPKAVT